MSHLKQVTKRWQNYAIFDRQNDCITFYVNKNNDVFQFSDGGNTVNELEDYGVI